jgi:hypothetical protein
MRIEELKTFAINTSKFYDQHCAMARECATPRIWQLHVRVNVLPEYRRAHREPYDGMTISDLSVVASELHVYYSNHVHESDAGEP